MLENGLLVKGSPATPVDQSSLTDVLRVTQNSDLLKSFENDHTPNFFQDHAKDQQLNQRGTSEAETETE